MVSKNKLAGTMALVALILPWFIAGGSHMYFAWTLFGFLSRSQTLTLSPLTQWALADTAINFLCFLCLAAGAALYFKAQPKLASTLVLSSVLISLINIIYVELIPVTATKILVIPVGLIVALVTVIQGFRMPTASAPKFNVRSIGTALLIVLTASASAIVVLDNTQTANAQQTQPQFCTHDFIQLNKINTISVFRSFEGHDYSDAYEHNLSMKHYFTPYASAGTIEIYSPTDGQITAIFPEQNQAGYQVQIQPTNNPQYTIAIFHLTVTPSLQIGAQVTAGQQIGTASATQGTDIAVWKLGNFRDKLISYFEVMTDDVFAGYQARGIAARSTMIRTATQAQTLSLTYSFDNPAPNDWVTLNPL